MHHELLEWDEVKRSVNLTSCSGTPVGVKPVRDAFLHNATVLGEHSMAEKVRVEIEYCAE